MQLLSLKQVAERLSISETSVKRMVASGELPYINVGASDGSLRPRKRISESDLFAFLEKRRTQKPARTAPVRRRQRIASAMEAAANV